MTRCLPKRLTVGQMQTARKQYSHRTDSISAKTPKASYEKSGFMLNEISRTSFISDISAISSLIGAHILMSWSIPLVARTESKRHSSWNF